MAHEVARSKQSMHAQSRPRTLATRLLASCLALAAGGCVLGGGDDNPVLSVDLLWDKNANPDRFSEGTCDGAGVTWNDWKLEDEDKKVVAKSDSEGEQCWDTIPFANLDPGEYRLVVTGYDENDRVVWKSVCTGLTLERFDSPYECKIDQIEP